MWLLRAWDERKKIMHNDFQFIRSGDTGADWIVFTSDKQTLDRKVKDPALPHPFDDPYFAQQIKIMRGIGLEDKNGKPIFEDDRLKDAIGRMFIVVYNESQWWAKSVVEDMRRGLDPIAVVQYDYEVVGNVWETQTPAII